MRVVIFIRLDYFCGSLQSEVHRGFLKGGSIQPQLNMLSGKIVSSGKRRSSL